MLNPAQRRVETRPISLAAAQESILPDETILEYVLAEPASYCLVVTHTQVAIVKLPAGQGLIDKSVSTFLNKITAGEFAAEEAKQLYSLLLGPVPDSLLNYHLVVVPDGSLYQLPFDALINPAGTYVLKTHVVSYVPSTTVLCFLRNRQRGNQTQMAFLGIGDVPYDLEPPSAGGGATRGALRFIARRIYDISGDHLYHLQATRQELIDASAALGRPRQSLLLLGATPPRPNSNLNLSPTSKSYISPFMDYRRRIFRKGQRSCWAAPLRVPTPDCCNSVRSLACLSPRIW